MICLWHDEGLERGGDEVAEGEPLQHAGNPQGIQRHTIALAVQEQPKKE